MKKILVFSLCFLAVQICFGQDNKFYDTILDYERCRNCYFLSVDVESEKYTGRVVIENDDLFNFLNKTKGFDKTQYKEFMKDLLLSKKKLALENLKLESDGTFINIKDISEREFRVVNEIKDIEEVSAKGCVSFVKYYFLAESLESLGTSVSEDCREFISKQKDDLLLERRLSTMEKSIIISKLFEWQIPTIMDEYSGLSIKRTNLKRPLNADKKTN